MNPTAIYSKSGKGVQEASGKTSILKRADRAVLSAIDGRATLAEVAEKVGKTFDPAFEALITQLDKDGFVREVSPGAAPAAPKPAAGAKPAGAPAPGSDLDFTTIMASPVKQAAPKPPAGPSPEELKAKADAAKRAKEQEMALMRARQEAEARAQADRERVRKEAEEKIRAETEARMRAEAEAKAKADTDAKAKALRAAAEAKVKAEAEAKKAREEAERIRKEAEQKAEQARREAEEKAKREQEEMRRQLEEERKRAEAERKAREEAERKAREEAERKAREEAERARKEAEEKARREQEELRKQLEAERKAREEAERKAREEAERARKEAEEKAKREQEEMRRQLEAERKAREEADRKRREDDERRREEEERARKAAEATVIARPATPPPPPPSQPAAGGTGGFADSLLADLDSFNQREEEERKAREAADRQKREEAERKAREAEERRRREEEERARKEAEDRRRREEEERRAREDEERRKREEEERIRAEAEERKRRAREAAAMPAQGAAAAASDDDIGVTEDDLDMDDVKRDEAMVSAEAKRRRKEKEKEQEEAAQAAQAAAAAKPARRPVKWGKPVALTLFVLLVVAVGAIHLMPISVGDYERAASEALGQPVKIGSGRVSVITGPRVKLDNVTVGSARMASVRAYPGFGGLFGANKSFSRIEIDGLVAPQEAAGAALFAKPKGENFSVERIVASQVKLEGPLVLPAVDVDVTLAQDGAVRGATLRGPDGLLAKVTPKDSEAEFDLAANGFTVPFAPDLKFGTFGAKGTANRQGMNIASWDGAALNGTLSGTAMIRWGGTWSIDGVITARGINAAVFAPALLSEGRGEGTGKFSMSGEPKQLASSGRLEGNFTINKGVLGSFDLSRAIQTGGRQPQGRTVFSEMNGQATYDKGAVALRNVTVGAGALNAGISADIAESGALSGRVVADVKTATQTLRATFSLAGTVKEPQVR